MTQALVSRSILTLALLGVLFFPSFAPYASAPTRVTSSALPDFIISANPTSLTVPAGSSANSTITLTSLNNFMGTVNLSTSPPPLCPSCPGWGVSPYSVNIGPGKTGIATLSFYTTLGSPLNRWIVTVTGTSGGLSHSVDVAFTVVQPVPQDFTMSANPQSLTITQGSSGTSTITVKGVGGFQGTVSLTPPATCASLSCFTVSVNPTSVTLTPNGSANAVLTISTTPYTTTGTYTIAVQGTSGSLSHSVEVTFTVVPQPGAPDFSMAANPSSLVIPAGTIATSTISLSSVNGFSGTVTVSSLSPSCPSPQCTVWSISPGSVDLVAGGTAKTTLTVLAGTQGGPRSITVYGSSGSLSHNVNVTITILFPVSPDFTITANQDKLTVDQGEAVSSTLLLTSTGEFQGNVSLVASLSCASGTCLSVTLFPTILGLAANGTARAILTVYTAPSATTGTYTITVTGTSGSLSHTVSITVTVVDPPASGGGGGRRPLLA